MKVYIYGIITFYPYCTVTNYTLRAENPTILPSSRVWIYTLRVYNTRVGKHTLHMRYVNHTQGVGYMMYP